MILNQLYASENKLPRLFDTNRLYTIDEIIELNKDILSGNYTYQFLHLFELGCRILKELSLMKII